MRPNFPPRCGDGGLRHAASDSTTGPSESLASARAVRRARIYKSRRGGTNAPSTVLARPAVRLEPSIDQFSQVCVFVTSRIGKLTRPLSGIAQSAARRTPSRRAHGTHKKAEHFERSRSAQSRVALGCGAAALGPEAALSHLGGQPSAGPDASRREPATRPGGQRAARQHGRPRNERI